MNDHREQKNSFISNVSAQEQKTARGGLSSFVLKVVAIVGMTCNHAAYIFAGHLPFIGECLCFAVGGVTFPVMAFLLVEGYTHTSSVKRYAMRLAVFAAVSQVPYMLFLQMNGNVIITLLIGLGVLYAHDHLSNRGVFWLVASAAAIVSLACDWGFLGVVMILMSKVLRDEGDTRRAVVLPITVAILAVGLPAANDLVVVGLSALPSLLYPLVGCTAAIPLLSAYDGRRGRGLKWFFYLYYPLHITVLGIAAHLLFS